MPYIEQRDRDLIDRSHIRNNRINTPGELNYAITSMLDSYLGRRGLNYANANEVLGVLEAVKQELYRRVMAPYEDRKKEERGDVYSLIVRGGIPV